jgi:hypothetical protein
MSVTLVPGAAATLARFCEILHSRDPAGLRELVHETAAFFSPYTPEPYPGGDVVTTFLRGSLLIFEPFEIQREFVLDAMQAGLQFEACIGEQPLRGVYLIAFAEDGTISRFEVMVRPAAGLEALNHAMRVLVGPEVRKQLETQAATDEADEP